MVVVMIDVHCPSHTDVPAVKCLVVGEEEGVMVVVIVIMCVGREVVGCGSMVVHGLKVVVLHSSMAVVDVVHVCLMVVILIVLQLLVWYSEVVVHIALLQMYVIVVL